jgi:hypothetical protein
MSERQLVRITGGQFWLGVWLCIAAYELGKIATALEAILERMP